MREPNLNNIEKHLNELVRERNPFTTPDPLDTLDIRFIGNVTQGICKFLEDYLG